MQQEGVNAQNPEQLPPNPPPYVGPPPPEIVEQNLYTKPQPSIGPKPIFMICPNCDQEILTKIDKRVTTATHLFALLCCALECWPCVCLPYCISACKNSDHSCPNCSTYLGTYKNHLI